MLFALIHLVAATVLAGAFIIGILAMPNHVDLGLKAIPLAALAGFVLAFPVAYVVARAIRNSSKTPTA